MDGSVPLRQASLDWRVRSNITFGAAGSGLAFTAAALSVGTGGHVIAAFLLAPLLVAAGIGLVWKESGQPKQFLQVFFRSDTSWKTRETLIAPVLVVATLVAAVLPFSLLLLLVMLASAGFLYAQARTLDNDGGAPAGRSVLPLILGTGAAEGAALLAVVATLTFSSGAAGALRLALVLALLRWLTWTIYRDGLGEAAPRAFGETRVAVMLWAPIGLLAVAVLLPGFIGGLVAILAGLAAAGAGWWLKSVVLGQTPSVPGLDLPAPSETPPA